MSGTTKRITAGAKADIARKHTRPRFTVRCPLMQTEETDLCPMPPDEGSQALRFPHGATFSSINIPGTATSVQSRKKFV